MRLAIVTSNRSVSLKNVADDIAYVMEDLGVPTDVYEYLPQRTDKFNRMYDSTLTIMSLNLIWGMPFFVFARSSKTYGQKSLVYTVIEGRPKRTMGDFWVFRDLEFVVPSKYVKRIVEKEGGTVLDVVYHGIDVSQVQQAERLGKYLRSTLGLPEGYKLALYVAAGYPRKAHDEAAHIMRMLKDEQVRFVVITDEDGAQYYQDVPNAVVMTKFGRIDREEVYGWYHAADIYVHFAYSEGFGLPVLEALAAGKLVVHPDYDPLSEITTEKTSVRVPVVKEEWVDLNDGVIYHYRRYSPEDFATAIMSALDLLDTEDQRDEVRARAIERAQEFDLFKTYSKFKRLLMSV